MERRETYTTQQPDGTYVTTTTREQTKYKEKGVWSCGRGPTNKNYCMGLHGILRIAQIIPKMSQLLWGTQKKGGAISTFPVVRLNNVVALPGIPKFCEKAFDELQDQLFPLEERPTMWQGTVYTDLDEFEFSKKLTELAAKFDDRTVQIGSYPEMHNKFFKTKLTVESESPDALKTALSALREMLVGHVVYYDSKAWQDTVPKWAEFKNRESQIGNQDFVSKLLEAERIVSEIVEKYPLDQIALSFNGGKDCTILLHLLRLKVDEKYGPGASIQGFHIMVEDQFPEATQFIIDAAKFYNIQVLEFPGPLKTGLAALKKQRPSIIAVLMGSRATDPNGKYMKTAVEWTDSDWPRVLRVCPILNWTYTDVWHMLRGLCVPYCKLYDQVGSCGKSWLLFAKIKENWGKYRLWDVSKLVHFCD
uniref:FAD synthase n=2 Tax=Caenorhabditis japonica TaxID=281687 RepID=A0A8R1IW84_CAEJA